MTDQWRKDLAALIDKAEADGMWLRCGYQDLWFSPQELRDANAEGRFVWGVVNWELRDPRELLECKRKAAESAAASVDELAARLANEARQ